MANPNDVVSSIQPTPNEQTVELLLRLRTNPDFAEFVEVFMRGRIGVLAYLSCAPAFTDKQCNYIHGRVHELADIVKMLDNIEQTKEEFMATRRAEGK